MTLFMDYYLSYLMVAGDITDQDLLKLNIKIQNRAEDSRMITIPSDQLDKYCNLIKNKLTSGFWNEVIGQDKIVFIFKFKDGEVKQFILTDQNEAEIDNLCARFMNEPTTQSANVYKFLAENEFYHDFMLKNYSDKLNR